MLQIIHRALSTFVIKHAGLTRNQAQTGAVTLIQRFGSAANLNNVSVGVLDISVETAVSRMLPYI